MQLLEASIELGVSPRQIHRLIRSEALPARKTTIMLTITRPIDIWDIDSESIATAKKLLHSRPISKSGFGIWLKTWTDRLDISITRLAEITRIKKSIFQSVIDKDEITQDSGLNQDDLALQLTQIFMRELIKQRKEGKRNKETDWNQFSLNKEVQSINDSIK